MSQYKQPSKLANSLATCDQIIGYQQQGVEALNSRTFEINLLTQSAGILLRLPQEVIATSIVILQRYLVSSASRAQKTALLLSSDVRPDSPLALASAACVYLAAKQSFYPLSPRSIINVYAVLTSPESSPISFLKSQSVPTSQSIDRPDPGGYHVSAGTYQSRRLALFDQEFQILASVGFDTKVVLPFSLALTYLSVLNVATNSLSQRVLAHLNAALLSPQLLYLTHQPNALAVAAIYLSAREQGIVLVDEVVEWWEVFDVTREELGFLVLSMSSLNGFVEAEQARYKQE